MKNTYPSDLTKSEWRILKNYLPRPRQHPRRKWQVLEIINAIFYVLRTGCQWRYLPDSFPPWQTVYWHWRRLILQGVWERINTALRICVRVKAGRHPQPSACVKRHAKRQNHRGQRCAGFRWVQTHQRTQTLFAHGHAGLGVERQRTPSQLVRGGHRAGRTRGVASRVASSGVGVGRLRVSGLEVRGVVARSVRVVAGVDARGEQAGSVWVQGASTPVGAAQARKVLG